MPCVCTTTADLRTVLNLAPFPLPCLGHRVSLNIRASRRTPLYDSEWSMALIPSNLSPYQIGVKRCMEPRYTLPQTKYNWTSLPVYRTPHSYMKMRARKLSHLDTRRFRPICISFFRSVQIPKFLKETSLWIGINAPPALSL